MPGKNRFFLAWQPNLNRIVAVSKSDSNVANKVQYARHLAIGNSVDWGVWLRTMPGRNDAPLDALPDDRGLYSSVVTWHHHCTVLRPTLSMPVHRRAFRPARKMGPR